MVALWLATAGPHRETKMNRNANSKNRKRRAKERTRELVMELADIDPWIDGICFFCRGEGEHSRWCLWMEAHDWLVRHEPTKRRKHSRVQPEQMMVPWRDGW